MAYQFSPATEKKFQWLLTRYPQTRAALIPLMHCVQREIGYLSVEAMDYIAARMNESPAKVREVASFYSMFRFEKPGTYVIQVCHNLTCYLRGADQLLKRLEDTLGIKVGETTPDGLFTLKTVECLASCGTAPAMQVNDWEYHEEMSIEKLDKVIEALRAHKWNAPEYVKRVEQGSVA